MDRNNARQETLLDGGSVNEPDSELWGPSDPRWLDDMTVAYDEDSYGENRYASDSMQTAHIQLKLINGKWKKSIIENPPVVTNQ